MRLAQFGVFELDIARQELRKAGVRIVLQPQPFHVLALLVDRAGEIVTREELRAAVWSADTFVEFDQSLNAAVKKIRAALNDPAVNPRFIETVPRCGYRFIAPVVRADATPPAESPGPRRHRKFAVAAAAVTAAALLLALLSAIALYDAAPERDSRAANSATPLTAWPGLETEPSVSPDGRQVALVWSGETGENPDIYVTAVAGGSRMRLTTHPDPDRSPVWSPDGSVIAFGRESVGTREVGVYVVRAQGGTERLVAKLGREWTPASVRFLLRFLDWSADSGSLIVSDRNSAQEAFRLFRLSVETGERQPLTSPPPGSYGDSQPAVSPRGTLVAFVRSGGHPVGDIYVMPVSGGEARRVTFDNSTINGIAWTPDGKGIVFSSERGGSAGAGSLWSIAASRPDSPGQPRALPGVGARARLPAIARHTPTLVYQESFRDTNLWRVAADGSGRPEPLISSTREEIQPDYSPDGRRLAFASNRSGNWEIWTANADGSDPVQVTSYAGEPAAHPHWSPDGRLIAFQHHDKGNVDVYVAAPEGKPVRRLTTSPSRDEAPFWSADGRFLYFTSDRSGTREVWKLAVNGSAARVPVRVTHGGGAFGRESSDGRYLYFRRTSDGDQYLGGRDAIAEIWRTPVAGGDPNRVFGPRWFGWWLPHARGMFFVDPGSSLAEVDFASGRITVVASAERTVLVNGLTLSPDRRWLVYGKEDGAGSDLMLVRDFHP